MSLASLGTRKYGRSVDSDSEGVVEEGREVERKVIVRHVPIVIEGSEGDCEVKAEKARQINTSQSKDQISFSKFSQAWNIPDDLSSLGSLTSENSLDSISRLDRIEEVVRAWMMRTEEEESRGRTENCGGRAGSSKIENKVVTPKTSDLTRKPFSDISQVMKSQHCLQINNSFYPIPEQNLQSQKSTSTKKSTRRKLPEQD